MWFLTIFYFVAYDSADSDQPNSATLMKMSIENTLES